MPYLDTASAITSKDSKQFNTDFVVYSNVYWRSSPILNEKNNAFLLQEIPLN